MARILVVDDSEHIRRLISITLRHRGHEVIEAENGRSALEMLQGSGTFDLVLTDLAMPEMNGFELLERIRDEMRDTAPPRLVLSAEPKETRDRVMALGAAEIMTKPFQPLTLLEVIDRMLS